MWLYRLFKQMPIPLLVYLIIILMSSLIALVGYMFLDWSSTVTHTVQLSGIVLAMIGIVFYVVTFNAKKR